MPAACQTAECKTQECCEPSDYGYTIVPDDSDLDTLVYFGRSLLTILTAAQVQTLPSELRAEVPGAYFFQSGFGYLFMAFPATLPTAFDIGQFMVALAGVAEGYTLGAGIVFYYQVTINTVVYNVFRTYNIMHGSVTFDVT